MEKPTMKALAQYEYGDAMVLQEIELPIPDVSGYDLRVKIQAVGINPVDVKVRTNWGGFGDLQGEKPVITGWDASGIVDAVGPMSDGRFKVGDEVFFAGSVARKGSHRQFSIVDSRVVGRKPGALSFAEAAALPLTSLTVWEALIDNYEGRLDHYAGQRTILIVGGAGGVGSIGIQLMKKVMGMKVIATASREESTRFCHEMGADFVISHRKPLAPQLQALGISNVDIVLHTSEPDENFDEIAELIAPFGKFVCILPIGRPVNTAPLFARSISLVYELMFTKGLFQVNLARQGQILDKISALADAGTLKSTLHDRFPWTVEGLRAAHARIDARNGLGKAVLCIEEK